MIVRAEIPLIDGHRHAGQRRTAETIQQIPLNGAISWTSGCSCPARWRPSQAGFSSRPIRGLGTLAFNTAGNREEAAGFIVNGVSTNNLTFGSLIFEPPIASIQEFKADKSVFAAEYGHVSGAVVNIVTRSGSDEFRGDVFGYLRNDALDARNFFEFTSSEPASVQAQPVRRIARRPDPARTDVLFRDLRRRPPPAGRGPQQPRAERRAARDRHGPGRSAVAAADSRAPTSSCHGTPRFVGSAPAVVDVDRWTADVRHNVGKRDRLHVFHGRQQVRGAEPSRKATAFPVSVRPPGLERADRQRHAHVWIGAAERSAIRPQRLRGGTFPAATLNPAEFGIGNGVTRAIGLPQMIVAGDLNFGGPGPLPQGRYDTLHVFADTFTPRAGGTRSRRAASTGISSTRTSPRAPARSTFRAWRRSCGHGELVQHHARRAAEPHRSARARRCSARTRSPSATISGSISACVTSGT